MVFPYRSEGSLIEKDGKVIGSALIGQSFTGEKYFHGRPSATLGPDANDPTKTVSVPYNAASSGASNYGPTSKALLDRVAGDVDKLRAENPNAPVPVDLVTTSAAASIPTSRPRRPCSRFPVLQGRAASPRTGCARS